MGVSLGTYPTRTRVPQTVKTEQEAVASLDLAIDSRAGSLDWLEPSVA